MPGPGQGSSPATSSPRSSSSSSTSALFNSNRNSPSASMDARSNSVASSVGTPQAALLLRKAVDPEVLAEQRQRYLDATMPKLDAFIQALAPIDDTHPLSGILVESVLAVREILSCWVPAQPHSLAVFSLDTRVTRLRQKMAEYKAKTPLRLRGELEQNEAKAGAREKWFPLTRVHTRLNTLYYVRNEQVVSLNMGDISALHMNTQAKREFLLRVKADKQEVRYHLRAQSPLHAQEWVALLGHFVRRNRAQEILRNEKPSATLELFQNHVHTVDTKLDKQRDFLFVTSDHLEEYDRQLRALKEADWGGLTNGGLRGIAEVFHTTKTTTNNGGHTYHVEVNMPAQGRGVGRTASRAGTTESSALMAAFWRKQPRMLFSRGDQKNKKAKTRTFYFKDFLDYRLVPTTLEIELVFRHVDSIFARNFKFASSDRWNRFYLLLQLFTNGQPGSVPGMLPSSRPVANPDDAEPSPHHRTALIDEFIHADIVKELALKHHATKGLPAVLKPSPTSSPQQSPRNSLSTFEPIEGLATGGLFVSPSPRTERPSWSSPPKLSRATSFSSSTRRDNGSSPLLETAELSTTRTPRRRSLLNVVGDKLKASKSRGRRKEERMLDLDDEVVDDSVGTWLAASGVTYDPKSKALPVQETLKEICSRLSGKDRSQWLVRILLLNQPWIFKKANAAPEQSAREAKEKALQTTGTGRAGHSPRPPTHKKNELSSVDGQEKDGLLQGWRSRSPTKRIVLSRETHGRQKTLNLVDVLIEQFKKGDEGVKQSVLEVLVEWSFAYYRDIHAHHRKGTLDVFLDYGTTREIRPKRRGGSRDSAVSPLTKRGRGQKKDKTEPRPNNPAIVALQAQLQEHLQAGLDAWPQEEEERGNRVSDWTNDTEDLPAFGLSKQLHNLIQRFEQKQVTYGVGPGAHIPPMTKVEEVVEEEEEEEEEEDEAEADATNSSKKATLLQHSPQELGNVLISLDVQAFLKIEVRELTNKAWTRKDTADAECHNLLTMVDHFNKRLFWACSQIVTAKSSSRRLHALKQMINVALHCFNQKDYYGAYALYSGVSLSPVLRLKRTWAKLPEKTVKNFETLKKEFDPAKNFTRYRQRFQTGLANYQTQVPHLPLLLKDLFQLQEIDTVDTSNPVATPDDAIINFHKFTKEWREIRSVLECQMQCRKHLGDMHTDKGLTREYEDAMAEVLDEEQLWEQSFLCEPKGGK